MNDVIKTILSRRSVRAYTDRQLAQEDLDLILEAGRYAPTAHNGQPWHFTVVQDKALIDEMNVKAKAVMAKSDNAWVKGVGSDPSFHLTYNAPTVIVVSGKKDSMGLDTDTCAAMENMLLAAESLGIGSVWVGLLRFYLTLEEAPASLRLPEGYVPMHGAAFGYAGGPKLPAPARNPDVVTYIR
ncbi:Nitroreductase [Sporobacter termitidis DSM 10068]|uniref:Nitroreductase n=1 Tax=Sporobacter termitidis DSM 10068 TaxID=1123282 RepID=A0A1M5YGI6_9FIRM|nr:nitroreductase family protein [Sporobacter termitidis]SHI11072.1 Nitroreductase [Sporobacter termitidis DSM 10068]